jgi:NitT/TauT family transport system substrate-binding protein
LIHNDITRRGVAGLLGAAALAAGSRAARAADQVRIGLPTKTYWPTIVAETALRRKLFEQQGIGAELTVYRGGAEAFEALAAGAADLVLDPPALVATALSKGVATKVVATGSVRYLGWQLMVPARSPITAVEQLAGKKVGITSAGSGSDLLALWTQQDRKIAFTRVPLGGGGLVPNLRSGNVDAIVLYSPLSFQLLEAKQARTLIDFAAAVPPHLNGAWIASDAVIGRNPALVQKALNALYGGLNVLRADRDGAIKLIAEIDEIAPEIAALEYENTILKLSTDATIDLAEVQRGLELAALGGMKDMAPAAQLVDTRFKVVPAA